MLGKIGKYFDGVKLELKKVTWLSKNEMIGSTFIVLVFAAIVSIFLFAVDFSLTEVMSRVLGGK
tara:strand:- start:258 stop:449 length:192 start_codon:yes stop_codon:yes gene_type:complete